VKEKVSARAQYYYWRPTPGQKRVKCSLHKISAKQNYQEWTRSSEAKWQHK